MSKIITFLKNNRAVNIFLKAFVFVFPAILFFAAELLNPGSSMETTKILGIELIRSPYNDVMLNLGAIIFSIILIFLILLILFCLIGNAFAAATIGSLLVYTIYIVNYYRRQISGWVFSPGDLNMAGNLNGILSFTTVTIEPRVVFAVILLIICLALVFFASKGIKMVLRKRLITLSAALFSVVLIFGTVRSQAIMYKIIGLDYNSFKTSNNLIYKKCGVALGFFIASQQGNIDDVFSIDGDQESVVSGTEPVKKGNEGLQNDTTPLAKIGASDFNAKYSSDFMNELMNEIKADLDGRARTVSPVGKPNIIVIMSEAFTDPTTWDNIEFSTEPTANLHALQKTSTHGNVVSPAFGGATCNPEFEFLTGFPMYFTAVGDVPFQQKEKYFSKDDIRSLPMIFNQNGYTTVGLHTYTNEIFDRRYVYPKLGFDKYIDLDDMADAPIKGRFVSDEFFTDKIIETFEGTEEPLFLYAISMQNHFEYYTGKYKTYDIVCQSDRLNEFYTNCTNAYLQGIYDADKQLGRLVEYLEASDKPTILYFFGDHLPLLGDNSAIYESLGYVKSGPLVDWDLDEHYKMQATPYVLWANYELPEHKWGDMSSYFIGPLLLELAGLDKNVYFDFLYNAYSGFHALKNGLYLNEDDNYYPTPLLQDKTVLDKLYYLNYDHTFGSGYSLKEQAKIE